MYVFFIGGEALAPTREATIIFREDLKNYPVMLTAGFF
jgi:hypothetical protein